MNLIIYTLLIFISFPCISKEFLIEKIKLHGTNNYSNKAIIKQLTNNAQINTKELFDNLLTLKAFTNISVCIKNKILNISLKEKPYIKSINVYGDDVNYITFMLKTLKITFNKPFDFGLLEHFRNRLEKIYQKKGFFNFKLKTHLKFNKNTNSVDIKINFIKNDVFRIKKIIIYGNKDYSAKRIKNIIETGKTSWTSWVDNADIYSASRLNKDLKKIREYYLTNGYIDFQLKSIKSFITNNKNFIYLIIVLHEGDKYRIADVKVNNKIDLKRKKKQRLFKKAVVKKKSKRKAFIDVQKITRKHLIIGDTLSFKNLTMFKKRLINHFYYKGFPTFSFKIKTTRVSPGKIALNIVYNTKRGFNRKQIKRIKFKGTTKISELTLRKLVKHMEYGWFNGCKLDIARQEIIKHGYAKSVKIKTPFKKKNQGIPKGFLKFLKKPLHQENMMDSYLNMYEKEKEKKKRNKRHDFFKRQSSGITFADELIKLKELPKESRHRKRDKSVSLDDRLDLKLTEQLNQKKETELLQDLDITKQTELRIDYDIKSLKNKEKKDRVKKEDVLTYVRKESIDDVTLNKENDTKKNTVKETIKKKKKKHGKRKGSKKKNVLFILKKHKTNKFVAGCTYNRSHGLSFNINSDIANFLGTGYNLSYKLVRYKKVLNINLNYLVSDYFDKRYDINYNIYFKDKRKNKKKYKLSVITSYGYVMSKILPLHKYGKLHITLGCEKTIAKIPTTKTNPLIKKFIDRHGHRYKEYNIGLIYIYNSLDRMPNPNNGITTKTSFKITVKPSDVKYFILAHEGKLYRELSEEVIFSMIWNFSYGNSYEDDGIYPFFKHFYLTGHTGVRGYKDKSLGPKDYKNQNTGGNVLLCFKTALHFPLPDFRGKRAFRPSIFLDAGQVYHTETNFCNKPFIFPKDVKFSSFLRFSVGASLFWATPFGIPIEFTFSYPINPSIIDKKEYFSFTITSHPKKE